MEQNAKTSETLAAKIKRWREYLENNWVPVLVGFVLSSLGAVVIFYVINFAEFGVGLSKDPDDWAAFGDYVGGVLNPIVAFAALTILAFSVGIQQRELHAARLAIKAQAKHAEDMVWLSAMVAVVDYQERRIAKLNEEKAALPRGGVLGQNTLVDMEKVRIAEQLLEATTRRDSLLSKIDKLVEQSALQN